MLNINFHSPQEIYTKYLKTLNGVKFTPREVDILASFVSGRSTKKIASILSIAPKTVEYHTRNIMLKLGCNSRESVIDFIENSEKLVLLRQYYSGLLLVENLEETLKEIRRIGSHQEIKPLIVCVNDEDLTKALLRHLESHLQGVGIHAEIQQKTVDNERDSKINSIIIIGNPNGNEEKILLDAPNYYFALLSILLKLIPSPQLERIINNFKQNYEKILKTYDPVNIIVNEQENKKDKRYGAFLKLKVPMLLCILFVTVVSLYILATQLNLLNHSIIKADRINQNETAFLMRPGLFKEIHTILNRNSGIQTIALIGIGGSGKTTLAHQYANQQKANIIWEFNAESFESLTESFENLAYNLAEKEEDKSKLRAIQEIKSSKERREKFLQFVKHHLLQKSNWVLIYDNLEKFEDVQNYFPSDPQIWGNGKVIITTRNNTLENNRNVNGSLVVGELTPDQKLSLFKQIITQGSSRGLVASPEREMKEFLEKIPPFPLDVSLAAYYLNATNISFDKYLENMKANDNAFLELQENLLKEMGDYSSTRYKIIVMPLKVIMNENKDFADLLLLMSMVDSQNIPIELLKEVKGDHVVDNFIYTLKKYSLILPQSSTSSSRQNLSIHRSTQAIALSYLSKLFDLETNKHTLDFLIKKLKTYAINSIEQEDFSRTKAMKPHYESLRDHGHYLTTVNKSTIDGLLGGIYSSLGYYDKAKEILEISLSKLANPNYQHRTNNKEVFKASKYLHTDLPNLNSIIGFVSVCLGNVYKRLGYYDSARDLLEKYQLNFIETPSKNPRRDIWALTILGDAYIKLRMNQKAKEVMMKSLMIYDTHPCLNLPIDLALNYSILAHACRFLDEHENAQYYIEKSYNIYKLNEKSNSENTLHMAAFLHEFGDRHKKFNKFAQATELLEKSLKIYKSIFPEEHSDIALVLASLGDAYTMSGNYKNALLCLNQSQHIYEKNIDGKTTSNYSNEYALLMAYKGFLLLELGDYVQARIALEKSYNIFKNKPDRVDKLWVLVYLGTTYANLGDLQKALDFIESSLEISRGKFGENNIHFIWIRTQLANIYRLKGEVNNQQEYIAMAKDCFEKNIMLLNKTGGMDHPRMASLCRDLGKVYLVEKNYKEAEKYIKLSVEIFRKHKLPQAYTALEALGDLYTMQLREEKKESDIAKYNELYKQARGSFLEALTIVNSIAPKNSPHIERIQSKITSLSKN